MIGIIGAGNVGAKLGRLWAEQGEAVIFGVRDPESDKVKSLLQSLPETKAVTISEAVASSEVVVLATPWIGTLDTLKEAGSFQGKVIIDCTNPLVLNPEGLQTGLIIGHSTSAAEEIAQVAVGAKVVKAFNNIGASQFGKPNITAFYCGDDTDAKEVVATLASKIGFVGVDVGNLKQARLLEPLGMLWINLAIMQGMGQDFAINLVK